MAQITWSRHALRDIDAIAEFIGKDSPASAAILVASLIEASFRIAEFPMSGWIIPEIGRPTRREMIVGPYRLMYRIAGRRIWVTAVVHGARWWRR